MAHMCPLQIVKYSSLKTKKQEGMNRSWFFFSYSYDFIVFKLWTLQLNITCAVPHKFLICDVLFSFIFKVFWVSDVLGSCSQFYKFYFCYFTCHWFFFNVITCSHMNDNLIICGLTYRPFPENTVYWEIECFWCWGSVFCMTGENRLIALFCFFK